MPLRFRLLRFFLWISVLACGVGLGAKLFDLLVVAGAWSASPPASLTLLPYGPHYPINPGDFFLPLSVAIVVGIFGALISGWKTPRQDRVWLLLPAISFALVWAITPTLFWSMNHQLYYGSIGEITKSDAELIQLTHQWIALDWFRVAMIALAFVSSVRAPSLPVVAKGSS